MEHNPENKKRRRFGIRQRVVLILLSGLLISLTINAWLSIQEQADYTESEIKRNGTQLSQVISRSLVNYVISYDYHSIQTFIDEVTKGDIAHIKVFSKKGNVMAETAAAGVDKNLIRVFFNNIQLEDSTIGQLELGLNTQSIIRKVEAQKESLVAREVGVIIFILLIEFIALSYFIVNPLSRISETLSKNTVNVGVLPVKIEINNRDEIGDIAEKFNHIRSQLNKAHIALQGEVDIADRKLQIANEKLLKKSQELEYTNQDLKNQAVTDPLTGLFNRRKFQSLLKNDIEPRILNNELLSFILVDIDHFKNINDKFGHDIGDRVLQEVALQLEEKTRKSDILCRIGGEEFAIFCYQAGKLDAISIAEKLRESIAACSIDIGEAVLSVTISIGVATPDSDAKVHCTDCLYRQADVALYQSKHTGRNKVTHFTEVELDDDIEEKSNYIN